MSLTVTPVSWAGMGPDLSERARGTIATTACVSPIGGIPNLTAFSAAMQQEPEWTSPAS